MPYKKDNIGFFNLACKIFNKIYYLRDNLSSKYPQKEIRMETYLSSQNREDASLDEQSGNLANHLYVYLYFNDWLEGDEIEIDIYKEDGNGYYKVASDNFLQDKQIYTNYFEFEGKTILEISEYFNEEFMIKLEKDILKDIESRLIEKKK